MPFLGGKRESDGQPGVQILDKDKSARTKPPTSRLEDNHPCPLSQKHPDTDCRKGSAEKNTRHFLILSQFQLLYIAVNNCHRPQQLHYSHRYAYIFTYIIMYLFHLISDLTIQFSPKLETHTDQTFDFSTTPQLQFCLRIRYVPKISDHPLNPSVSGKEAAGSCHPKLGFSFLF